jgi:hypothetical protein
VQVELNAPIVEHVSKRGSSAKPSEITEQELEKRTIPKIKVTPFQFDRAKFSLVLLVDK